MPDLSPATQRRITLLAILPTVAGNYADALEVFDLIADDGRFFDSQTVSARPPTQPSGVQKGTSRPPASSSSASNSGRDGAWSGQPLRDPDGPPSERQVAAVLKLTSDYTEDEVWSMTKQQVSDLISDLKG